GNGRRGRARARDPAGGAARMTGRIRDEAIRTVRERASLSEVVSDVVALRRRGRSAVALCPFHAEKTPSFTVSEERGFFHCFGCGPGAGEVLARHLRAKSVPLEDALTAGLVMRRDRPDGAGGVLDRFRERIMFPITDTSGKVIAFGGRILPGRPASGEPPPKYL